jgi:SH3 domain protein
MLAVAIGAFLAAPVAAETLYVDDIVKITVRTGKGTDHKIIRMISTGESVEVIEKDSDWSRVMLADGTEGWVLTRLLTEEPPAAVMLERLRTEHRELLEKTRKPLEEINRLASENAMLEKALTDLRQAYQDLEGDNASLREQNVQLLEMKEGFQEAGSELDRLRSRAETLDTELSHVKRDRMVRWFLAGAAVLLGGFFMGVFARPRRKRSFLE